MTHWMTLGFTRNLLRSNKTKGSIVRTLAAVFKMLWNGECKYISSKHLKAVIAEQDHLFYGTEQQDSHEFLVMLIDWLQSDLQTISVVSFMTSFLIQDFAIDRLLVNSKTRLNLFRLLKKLGWNTQKLEKALFFVCSTARSKAQ